MTQVQTVRHNEFFHHYSSYDKAKKKANEKIRELEKNSNISSARYKILERDTTEGKESGHFNMLNRIYKYAVELQYNTKEEVKEAVKA